MLKRNYHEGLEKSTWSESFTCYVYSDNVFTDVYTGQIYHTCTFLKDMVLEIENKAVKSELATFSLLAGCVNLTQT